MAKRNKFMSLFESAMNRYQRGGFLIGDVFKFDDNFKNDDEYKDLGQNVKDFIDDMIESGLNIKVVGIKDSTPQRYPAGNNSSSLHTILDIALDNTGGRFTHQCSIPSGLGQPGESPYPNLDPIPDSARRKDRVNIKPEELSEDEENLSNKTDRGDGKLSQTERKLPSQNTAIPSSGEAKPTTDVYMKGLK